MKLFVEIAGVGAVLAGVAMIFPPGALILGGLAVVAAVEVRG